MEATLTYTAGKALATKVVPFILATRVAAVIPGGPVATDDQGRVHKTPFSVRTGVAYTHEKYPEVTALRGKYHRPGMPKYEPHQIAARSEYDGENVQTHNNLAGSVNSVSVYEDNKGLYNRLVSGDMIPCQWGQQGDNGPLKGFTRDKQITPADLLAGMRLSETDIRFCQKNYNIPDDQKAMLGSRRFFGMMADKFPGAGLEKRSTLSHYCATYKTIANATAVIRPYYASKKANGSEHRPIDSGYIISMRGTDKSKYTVATPSAGDYTQDNLTEMNHFTNMWRTKTEMSSSDENPGRSRRQMYPSLQAAILEVESLGLNWYVESDKSNAWPVSRHPLYAANFTYRGCTKMRMNEKGAKRQKGGNAPRVSEWDPSLENHFEGKTKEDVFFA
eukprot:TRINITY_DN3494_c4_g1_i1.p1 TRINITY_DN3494_c4_g1~~TRINITY_DN3494_c4_g1_i1.p1  ORF type:complete len:408 (+),score=53.84 TRINITY_DN3494_c4_g1_i1:55-1224(+)